MELIFNYNEEEIIYQSLDNKEKINEAFHKYRKNTDINTLTFSYFDKTLDGNSSIEEMINTFNIEKNKIDILVTEKNNFSNSSFMNSKDIICPKCGERAKFDIIKYMLLLQCLKGHNIGNIFLDKFEKTQKIDNTKIICDECKLNFKANSDKNNFYKCNQCKKNLCEQCNNKHKEENKEHNIINYENKNYICDIHNEKYNSFCKQCNKNICTNCNNEHKEHEIIYYENLLPNLNEVENKNKKLRNDINKLKSIINDMINKLNKVKYTMDYFYNINKKIYNLIKNNNINYEVLHSYNQLNKSEILNDINDIINNNRISYEKIDEICDKINYKFCEEITIKYQIKPNDNKIKIFGQDFINNNKENCKMVIEGEELEIKDLIELNDLKIKNNILEIKLKGIHNVTNMSCLFYECKSIISLPDISNLNLINVTNLSYMFRGCLSLNSLPDISIWNTSNINNMSFMFRGCSSLNSLPDISKWDTSNVNDMSFMFNKCSSLNSLPEISKWDTKNVKNMRCLFSGCTALKTLPDISKWNTENVNDMSGLFYECKNLECIPDISNWNMNNVSNMSFMFRGCSSLISLPDIKKWNINNAKDMKDMFEGCNKVKDIPKFNDK